MNDMDKPIWIDDKGKIDEPLFCDSFAEEYKFIYMNGLFYNLYGEIKQTTIESVIFENIRHYVKSGLAKKVKSLIDALKIYCNTPLIMPDTRRIHVKNGVIEVNGDIGTAPTFTPKLDYCRNRLNIDYKPEIWNGVYYPENFMKFLYELLDDKDILTLQEYLGYCLVADTKGQVMMSIIGSGGEGKSRIGVVLQEIFKNNKLTGNYQRIETDRFFRYNLINKLLILDDDMQMTALNSTGYIKTLITSEIPLDVEAKGKQSCQEYLYSRILTFGNGSPKALYDHSAGYIRRLLILTAKPKPHDRIDDPFISEKFIAEKEKIFCWMLDGLRRLLKNKYKFTVSEKTKANVEEIIRGAFNISEFLEDKSCVMFEHDGSVTSKNLYDMYYTWCEDNSLTSVKRDTFIKWLKENAEKYNIAYSNHILYQTKYVRGFQGMRLNGFIAIQQKSTFY